MKYSDFLRDRWSLFVFVGALAFFGRLPLGAKEALIFAGLCMLSFFAGSFGAHVWQHVKEWLDSP